jgi:hypothetical protein
MSVTISPPIFIQFFDPNNSGAPLAGGKLFTYQAGTSIKQTTWTDSTQTSVNTNPIILDSNGVANIWLDPTLRYKFVLSPANDTDPPSSPLRTVDNVSASLTIPALTRILLGQIIWPQTPVEIVVGVLPIDFAYLPVDPRRYNSISDWVLVYNAITSMNDTFWPFYRGDHAQHPSQTNTIVGWKSYNDAQKTGTVGYRCTFFGAQAGQLNSGSVTAGGTNTGFGWAALQNIVESSGNTAVGAVALNSLTGVASAHNNAFGYRVLTLLVNGTQNNCFGFQTANSLITGDNNHAYGENVLQALTTGFGNHIFGYQGGFNTLVADFMHGFGYQVFTSQSQGSITNITKAATAVVTISTVSGANPFTVGSPIAIEGVSGMTQINGVLGNITAIGGVSGAWTITTDINSSTFTVYGTGGSIFPVGNTGMGYQAGAALNCAGANTLIGWQTGQVNPVDYGNTAIGYQAGRNLSTGGTRNTAVGLFSLVSCLGGINNSCLGFQAGSPITTGGQNVCVGDSAGAGISTASQNVAVGSATSTNLNGASNTSVGFNAGSQGSPQTFTNTSSFGNGATPTASNQVTLGNASVATLRCQQTTITALSDARFKTEIDDLAIPDGFLDEVRTVTFKWLDLAMPTGTQVGVIAQELDALQIKYDVEWLGLVDKTNPDRLEATPGKLLIPLLQRVQQQERRLQRIEALLSM